MPRRIRIIPALAVSLHLVPFTPAQAQQPQTSEECWNKAVTQADLTACAITDLDNAELQMEALYAIVLDKVRTEPETLRKIRAAQEAWRAFKQAHIAAIFPKADSPDGARAEYGSVFPMCWAGLNAQLVQERIAQIREWAEGIEEGDVCTGSRGIADN